MKFLAAIAFLAVASPLAAQHLPFIAAQDLNKKKIEWPKDFSADRTLLIVAFARGQQPQIDTWVSALKLNAPGAPPWFEVPVIKNPGSFVRSFIDGGMRRGIPSSAARSHVVTVYTDKKAFMAATGLPSEDVHVLVVARSGAVLARATGGQSAPNIALIEAALKR